MNAPFRNLFTMDTLMNLVSGLGTVKDKTVHAQYTLPIMDQAQLEAAYRGDWIVRKGINIPAFDMCREWRSWQAKDKQIEQIETLERTLGLQTKVMKAMVKARLYGGSALVMGVGVGKSAPEEPLELDRVGMGDLSYVHVVSRHEIQTGEIDRNIISPTYGEPEYYSVTPVNAGQVKIHPSRVVRFLGNEMPDLSTAVDGWGDPVLQSTNDATVNVGTVMAAVAALVNEAKIDVIKIPNLMDSLSTDEYSGLLTERFALANKLKSIVNTLVIDGEEEWQRIEQNFGGLPEIVKIKLLIACAAWDIPATRFLGQSAVGLNATGDGDARNYYDRLSSEQEIDLKPRMTKIDEVLIRSATGGRDDSIYYGWSPLWQMSEPEKAEVSVKKAQAFQVDVNAALIDPEVLRVGRQNQLIEDGTYPGMDKVIEESDAEEPLDENDPEVAAAFGSATGTETPVATADLPKPQDQGLNGAQIKSMMEIVAAVGTGDMPPEVAIQMLLISFPTVEEKKIRAMVQPMEEFEPPTPEPPVIVTPGDPAPPPAPRPPKAEEEDEDEVVQDAQPRTLYVRRDVLNKKELATWAKEQGLTLIDDPHVTVLYSKEPVDWTKMGESYGDEDGKLHIPPGGMRMIEQLGPEGAIVLRFLSSMICYRHEDMVRQGASHGYPEYIPHVTITYEKKSPKQLELIKPYQGKLDFGPEIFEEIET